MDKLIKKINTSPLIRRRVISGDATQCFSKTFGVPLKILIEREEFSKVPRVLTNICEFLLLNGLETEGIFRVNGNTKAVESIKLLFQENYSANLSNYTDVYAVASVLKLFLRELPDGVVPERIGLQFVEVYKHHCNYWETCIEAFRSLLSNLSEENFNLLKYLCQFLAKISEKEEFNKMNCVNLGIVFGPNVFQSSHDMEGLKMQTSFNNVMTALISHCQQLFKHNATLLSPDIHPSPSHICLDTPLATQALSTDVHKSSPSLSGDFDLSSSNDNQLLPAPLPSSISSNLHRAIMSCVNNHLTVAYDSQDPRQLGFRMEDTPSDIELRMNRTTSLPHSIFKYSYDLSSGNNESNEFSTKSEMEPTAPPRSTVISNGKSNLRKGANRKPLLATQGRCNDLIVPKDISDFNYLASKAENGDMMDDIMQDWQDQNDLIDLDDFDGDDYLMNEMKENSLKTQIPIVYEHQSVTEREHSFQIIDRKSELQERHRFLRNKVKEFEDNFEFLHGCRPPNIEKTGNSQVQEWLAELANLKEQLDIHSVDNNFENLSSSFTRSRGCIRNSLNENISKPSSNLQSGTSTLSGVSDQTGAANKLRGISNLETINVQNIPVSQFLVHLNEALESQRNRVSRPESFTEMTKDQFEEEKIDLQKCLLHFEKNYGRPKDHDTKQIMKPLYDRYRLVKRYIKTPENELRPLSNLVASQINGEYCHSSTSLSSRHKGFQRQSEEDTEGGESTSRRGEHLMSTAGYNINHQMSHSFTAGSDDKTNCRRSSSGSLRSSGTQDYASKVHVSPNMNTTKTSKSSEGHSQRTNCGGNVKSKYYQAPVTQSAQNSTIPSSPLHSVYSTKSFNAPGKDIKPFRSSSTMTKTDIASEKDALLVEKRRLQKLLKDFEHGLEKITSRKVDKSDRDHMRAEYDRYKTIKCRLRVLDRELECQ